MLKGFTFSLSKNTELPTSLDVVVLSQCKSIHALVADDSREATLHASLVREIKAFLCLLNKQITLTEPAS